MSQLITSYFRKNRIDFSRKTLAYLEILKQFIREAAYNTGWQSVRIRPFIKYPHTDFKQSIITHERKTERCYPTGDKKAGKRACLLPCNHIEYDPLT